jgi:hypothetical protein
MAATLEIVISEPDDGRDPAGPGSGAPASPPSASEAAADVLTGGAVSRSAPSSPAPPPEPAGGRLRRVRADDVFGGAPLESDPGLRDAMRDRIAGSKRAEREAAASARKAASEAAAQARREASAARKEAASRDREQRAEARRALNASVAAGRKAAADVKREVAGVYREQRAEAARVKREQKAEAARQQKEQRSQASAAKQEAARQLREQKALAREQAREQKAQARTAARAGAAMARMSQKAQDKVAREKAEKEKESKKADREAGVAAAGVAAAAIRGGGIGSAAGGALGAVVGGRFGGTAGAVVGGAVGGKVGGFVDNPAAPIANPSAKIAQNDGIGALTDAADSAAVALAFIPGVGLPAALALKTFTGVVNSAVEVVGAFNDRGRELAGFDARIAGATARQDVTRLKADIREAQTLGGDYAKVIDKVTEFEEVMKVLLLPLKQTIMETLPQMMDWMMDFGIAAIEALDAMLVGDYGLKEVVAQMEKARSEARRGAGGEFDIARWLRGGGDLAFGPAAVPPAPGPLGIPLIPGAR